MMMTLNRDYQLVSLCGRATFFKEGVPAFVVPHMVKEAIALGAVAAPDEDKALVAATMAEIEKETDDNASRAPKIAAAIKTLVERNQRGDFTAGGRPNLNVLAKLTGFLVTAQELEPIWLTTAAELA